MSLLRNLGRMTREEVVALAQRRELGRLIDELGVRQQLDPDETVCGAVVLITVPLRSPSSVGSSVIVESSGCWR